MPDDTDRIIAAHREEARKTRLLLVWLFVGIPVAALCVWGFIALAAVGASSQANDAGDSTLSSCDDAVDVDLTVCPLSGPQLAVWSTCADYTADANQTTDPDKTNPAVQFTKQYRVSDEVRFDKDCAATPTAMLSVVLAQEGLWPPPADSGSL